MLYREHLRNGDDSEGRTFADGDDPDDGTGDGSDDGSDGGSGGGGGGSTVGPASMTIYQQEFDAGIDRISLRTTFNAVTKSDNATVKIRAVGDSTSRTLFTLSGGDDPVWDRTMTSDLSSFAGENVSVRMSTTGEGSILIQDLRVKTDTDGDGYWDGWLGVYDVGWTDNVVLYREHLLTSYGLRSTRSNDQVQRSSPVWTMLSSRRWKPRSTSPAGISHSSVT